MFRHRNWSCRYGEIDLIMDDGTTRVFVEVRTRAADTKHGHGAETVSSQKQQKLLRTAQAYQQQEDFWGDVRFDVVAVAIDDAGTQVSIDHIEAAFGQP